MGGWRLGRRDFAVGHHRHFRAHLDPKDRAYFRQTREQRLGATLEAISSDRDVNVTAFRKTLEPIRAVLAAQPYLGGKMPTYADYVATDYCRRSMDLPARRLVILYDACERQR